MGVPAFYRWLSEKYPKIVADMMEKRPTVVNGVRMPLDLTEPNPNGMEFDNLYVDMNGIIHPCAHPEDGPQPKTEEEMYVNVMKYVDRLMSAVRPRRVLYLAVDGVAPRAKMNQQRSRRFRAAQEAQEHREVMEETRKEMIELGLPVPPVSGPAWDSNVITPGTAFMQRLSVYLRFYIQHRINTNKAWRNIKVILSDANQPGEGEHKVKLMWCSCRTSTTTVLQLFVRPRTRLLAASEEMHQQHCPADLGVRAPYFSTCFAVYLYLRVGNGNCMELSADMQRSCAERCCRSCMMCRQQRLHFRCLCIYST
eukprot:TRINITY_DN4709_c0_g1_i2.p1 TRINITY_DN4709_c0_g1~~TRINITY_DN4709_c0_g1_i2.p1  ORF type:complete len:310 (+),score=71.88 TRINITY_DN4709_c0_g1_i2:188-1117(+)